jgi:hypothetical protein
MMFLIDPGKPRKPIGRLNPLIVHEARTNRLRSGRWMIRTFYAALLVSLLLASMTLHGGGEHPDLLRYMAVVLVSLQLGVVALVGPSLTASSISGEIEAGTFESLRLTLLRPGQVFWGKFLPAFGPAVLPVIAFAPAYGAICYIDTRYLLSLTRLAPVVLMAVATCCTLGLICSAFARSTPRATVSAYLIVISLFILPLIVMWTAGILVSTWAARWVWLASPLAVALSVLPGSDPDDAAQFPRHLALAVTTCALLLLIGRTRLSWLLRRS